MTPILEIKNLTAGTKEKTILKDFSLTIKPGETHVIMGPNGCGKTTLSKVLAGDETYQVSAGTLKFNGEDILTKTPDERANLGMFLAFQNPVELPGVGVGVFLKTALNAKRAFQGKEPLDPIGFMKRLKERANALNVSDDMLKRFVNVGFSGGEKKKLEVLQMAFLEPDFCILDEMDAGLDVDALKVLSAGVNVMRSAQKSFLMITHYQRLLEYIVPDYVHVMKNGRIQKSGDKTLALEVEKNGYDAY